MDVDVPFARQTFLDPNQYVHFAYMIYFFVNFFLSWSSDRFWQDIIKIHNCFDQKVKVAAPPTKIENWNLHPVLKTNDNFGVSW
jgi:hypothetical protein